MPFYSATIRITAAPPEAAEAAGALESHLRTLGPEGRILLVCRYEKQDGYLVIFQAKDLLSARDMVEALPLVREGLAAWNYREVELIEENLSSG